MKNLLSHFISLAIIIAFFLLPAQAGAQSFNLIVCDGPDCTFNSLVKLVQNLITAMVVISTFLATGVFAYAGILLLTSGGSESAKTKAKDMFTKVLIGYLWILGAWVVVYTITSILVKPDPDYTILKK